MATAAQPAQYGFNDTAFSWNAYDDYRPAYPPALWSLIFSHHSTHHPIYTSALDLGCGSGAASATLAHHFSHLTVADPSEHNLASARAKLSSEPFLSSLPRPCTITYHTLPGELPAVDPGTQDMVTMFEAIHWGDAAAIMAQAGRALKPGGTLALANYSPRPTILQNPTAQKLWNAIWQAHTDGIFEPDAAKPAKGPTRLAIEQANAGLAFVPLDPQLWRPGARRINLNCGTGGAATLQLHEGEQVPIAPSRVQPGREGEEEMEMAGWEKVVGPEWFHAYYWDTFQSSRALPDDFEKRVKGLWSRLQEAVKVGGEGGKARIVFPAAVVLASRR
ncbi:hypothetical protein MMC30_004834 [Trapelia coarctata]|nr:hypothetical protein [Trapelia coarctata]